MRQQRGLRSTPKVFNADYRPPKQFNWQAVKVFMPAVWLVVIVVGFLLLTRLPLFRIADIQVIGTDQKDIVAAIESLKGQSIFSHAVGSLEKDLPNQFFTIKTVNCSRGLPSTLKCQVSLRTPSMVWKNAEASYAVDSDGIIYANSSTLSAADLANLVTVVDKRNVKVGLGEAVVNQDILGSMTKARQLFVDRGYVVGDLAVDEAFYQFTLNLVSASANQPFPSITPLPVLMTSTYSIDSQVTAAQELLSAKAATIKQQIDLRTQGYAYIK